MARLSLTVRSRRLGHGDAVALAGEDQLSQGGGRSVAGLGGGRSHAPNVVSTARSSV